MSVSLVLGELRTVCSLSVAGTTVPDGDGGFTQASVPLSPPTWRCAIEKASARASERKFAATVTAHATYIMSGRYHPGITTETIVTWVDRGGTTHVANVLDVDDTEGAGVETVIAVSEVAQ